LKSSRPISPPPASASSLRWAWLSSRTASLKSPRPPTAKTTLVHGGPPILGRRWSGSIPIIDYRNRRPDYLRRCRSSGELGICRPAVLEGLIIGSEVNKGRQHRAAALFNGLTFGHPEVRALARLEGYGRLLILRGSRSLSAGRRSRTVGSHLRMTAEPLHGMTV